MAARAPLLVLICVLFAAAWTGDTATQREAFLAKTQPTATRPAIATIIRNQEVILAHREQLTRVDVAMVSH